MKKLSSLNNKAEDIIHIRNSKQPLNHGIISKKVHRVYKSSLIQFINACLKPYIDMNADL